MSGAGDALLDIARLQRWIDDKIPGQGEALSAHRLGGGSSNLMFRLERAGRAYVLRRPPRARYDATSHNIGREITLYAALGKTDVPHARLVTYSTDTEIIGAPFVVTAFVDGFSPLGVFPEPIESEPALRRQVGLGMVEGIAKLAKVDWCGIGLEGFGKPAGFLDRQVDRWMGQLERYRTREIPLLNELARWLADNRPQQGAAGIIHGDYSFPNTMFAPSPPVRMAAIVDWESATIGDPLLDLGHLLAGWCDPGETRTYLQRVNWKHMPTRAEMAARYAELTGLSVANVDYYRALALFKLAIILEGAYARFLNGQSDYEGHRTLDVRVPQFIEQAYSFTRTAA